MPSCEPITTLTPAMAGECGQRRPDVELPQILAALQIEHIQVPVARSDHQSAAGDESIYARILKLKCPSPDA